MKGFVCGAEKPGWQVAGVPDLTVLHLSLMTPPTHTHNNNNNNNNNVKPVHRTGKTSLTCM